MYTPSQLVPPKPGDRPSFVLTDLNNDIARGLNPFSDVLRYRLNPTAGTYTGTLIPAHTTTTHATGANIRLNTLEYSGFATSPTTRTIEFEFDMPESQHYVHVAFAASLLLAPSAATSLSVCAALEVALAVNGAYQVLFAGEETATIQLTPTSVTYYPVGLYRTFLLQSGRRYRIRPLVGQYSLTLPTGTITPQNNLEFAIWSGG